MLDQDMQGKLTAIATVLVAVCTLLGLVFELTGSFTVILWCQVVFVICSILALLFRTHTAKWAVNILRAVSVFRTVSISGMTVGLLSLGSITLANILVQKGVTRACEEIARETKNDILDQSRADHEFIVASLADSPASRKIVYGSAFAQATDKGYIYLRSEWYSPSEAWRDGNGSTTLLTDEEKRVVARYLSRRTNQGQREVHSLEELYDMMYSILSDDAMIMALQREKAYNVPSVNLEEESRKLSVYDKVGIIGAYISELVTGMPSI